MKHSIKTSIFLLTFSLLTVACASKETEPTVSKQPASSSRCQNCKIFLKQADGIMDKLSEEERQFDPEDYQRKLKQAAVRTDLAKHIDVFLKENSLDDHNVMDAVLDVWMLGVDYERQSEIGEWNFHHFKPVLSKIYARIAQRIAMAKSDEKKRRLKKIELGLYGTEGTFDGDPQG